MSLQKPAHLAATDGPWLARRKYAVIALGLGVVSFVVVAIVHGKVTVLPDWRLSVPGFVVTAAAAGLSLARREPRAYWLWALGLGLAGAAIVLGWFLMLAVVIGATAVLILILHAFM